MSEDSYFLRKVLVIDNDSLLRGLLTSQMTGWGFEAHEADSAKSAVAICNTLDPDAVIMDVDLGPGIDGFQLAEALIRKMPHLAVVFLTRYPDARASMSRLSGALKKSAYLNKNSITDTNELLDALNSVLIDQRNTVRHDLLKGRPLSELSNSQLEVLKFIYEGKTNVQIAEIRDTTLSAVEHIIGRIFKALDIDVTAQNPRIIASRMYADHYGVRETS